jgi:hypothetical protein
MIQQQKEKARKPAGKKNKNKSERSQMAKAMRSASNPTGR